MRTRFNNDSLILIFHQIIKKFLKLTGDISLLKLRSSVSTSRCSDCFQGKLNNYSVIIFLEIFLRKSRLIMANDCIVQGSNVAICSARQVSHRRAYKQIKKPYRVIRTLSSVVLFARQKLNSFRLEISYMEKQRFIIRKLQYFIKLMGESRPNEWACLMDIHKVDLIMRLPIYQRNDGERNFNKQRNLYYIFEEKYIYTRTIITNRRFFFLFFNELQ